VPMEEPFFGTGDQICQIGSGGRLVHENVEGWTGHPGDGLFRDSRRIGLRQTSWQSPHPHVILVAASDGFPISRLQLKPLAITFSGMLPLVCGAAKDLRPLQIGMQRADLGRRRTRIVESPRVHSSERVFTVLAFAIGFDNVGRREFAAIVVSIKHDADSNLPKIAQALRNLGVLFGPRKRRKEKTHQYGDYRYYDQQFNKSESSVAVLHWIDLCFAVPRGHKYVLRRVAETI